MTELGSALKFETDEPHFVSLGGGRLSIGVTLCPIKRGRGKTNYFFLAFNKITDSASDLKLCSHLVPEHGARAVWLSLGTNVNAP